jgi:hypothetical protein
VKVGWLRSRTAHARNRYSQFMRPYSLLITLFFTSLSFTAFSQVNKLDIISGKSKVLTYLNNKLNSIELIDSLNKKIEIYLLGTKNINNYPKFDSTHFIRSYTRIFYDKFNTIDSIITIEYEDNSILYYPTKVAYPDTLVWVYNYAKIDKIQYNKELFRISNGKRTLINTEILVYNGFRQIISRVDKEGKMQYNYSYNKEGQIVEESICHYKKRH